MMVWIIIFVLVQLMVAGVVVVVLKHLLNKELIEAALEKLEFFKPAQGSSLIMVSLGRAMDDELGARFESLRRRRFAEFKIEFKQDKSLKGGVIVIIGNDVLDFSLNTRLKNFWS